MRHCPLAARARGLETFNVTQTHRWFRGRGILCLSFQFLLFFKMLEVRSLSFSSLPCSPDPAEITSHTAGITSELADI